MKHTELSREASLTSRRGFLTASGSATAFLLSVVASEEGILEGTPFNVSSQALADSGFSKKINPYIQIDDQNQVTVFVKHLEMGQGVFTGLPTLIAEELDYPWEKIKVEHAPSDPNLYYHLFFGKFQATGGSTSTANSYLQLRHAGAATRALFIQAAALKWKVDPAEITTRDGELIHTASQNQAPYSAFLKEASALTPPQNPVLKSRENFKYIGKKIPRKLTSEKLDGSLKYSLDQSLPGQLTAIIARPPQFGAMAKRVGQPKKMAGVKGVFIIPQGVVVLAKDFWTAKKVRDTLEIQWELPPASQMVDTEKLKTHYLDLVKKKGEMVRKEGGVDTQPVHSMESTFVFPYLAHAPMEPLNCIIHRKGSGAKQQVHYYSGVQSPTADHYNLAARLGMKPENIHIHILPAGGSFGRRASPSADLSTEAAEILKAAKGIKAPIRLVWTREDDIKGGMYRPFYVHKIRMGWDGDQNLSHWDHHIVGQSIMKGTSLEKMMVKNGIDQTSIEGASTLPYEIPNLNVELTTTTQNVPVLWWRSVGNSHNAYSTELMINEFARQTKQDPAKLRQKLLSKHPRLLNVLNLVLEKSNWFNEKTPENTAKGLAVHESFGSVVAQVATVRKKEGVYVVTQVHCAVDCGLAINPEVVRAQMEGGIGFGLGAFLAGEIHIQEGKVLESNFHDYKVLRMNQMPQIEVHIVASDNPPSGVGEPGVPPIAPAVASAILALEGRLVTQLPLNS